MVNFLDQAENDSKNHLTRQKKEIKYITLLEIVLIIMLLIQSWFFRVIDLESQGFGWFIILGGWVLVLMFVITVIVLAVHTFLLLDKWKIDYIREINIYSFIIYLVVNIIFLFGHAYWLFWFPAVAYSLLTIVLVTYGIRHKLFSNFGKDI